MAVFRKILTRLRYNTKSVIKRNHCIYNTIKSKIDMTGPITVADYMKEVLTNPKSGYYMNNDVFGKQGDFITSPEISQLMGEILAIWTITEWQKLRKPMPFQLIEFGPGRGTMMQDILRVYDKLGILQNQGMFSIHLVEVSKAMSQIQAKNLCAPNSIKQLDVTSSGCYQTGLTQRSLIPVNWYQNIHHVPNIFSIILAHEFFDALPIHKFQKVENEWREILIDKQEEQDNNAKQLRYVISRNVTPASLLFAKDEMNRNEFEVSPQSALIMQELASRLEEKGGFALIIDYGHEGEKTDTFRAFKQHRLHDPLLEPGTADLTADVDFSYLQKVTSDKLMSVGPISQHQFLTNMHINVRLEILLKGCQSEEDKDRLISGYKMIMDKNQMGERFKLLSFFPIILTEFLKQYPVAGFG